MTIDELVRLVKPDYVSIDNPVSKGNQTPGTTKVASVQIDFDAEDGIMMYITI